jgi:hypothetical protein
MALKGKETSREELSGERAAGRSDDGACREAATSMPAAGDRALGCDNGGGFGCSGEAESLWADEPSVNAGGDPPGGRPHGAHRLAGASTQGER